MNEKGKSWGVWVAQSVKHLILDFGSDHDLTVCEIKPHVRLHADLAEPAWDSLPPSLCTSVAHVYSFPTRRSSDLTWVAQSVEYLMLDFGSDHDLTVHGIEPCVRFCTDSVEPAWDSLSPSLFLLLPHLCSCSLSLKINK